MTEVATIPVTLRLSEEVVEELKVKARAASFSENRDISYVDLIRSAIGRQYGIEDRNGELIKKNEDPDLAYFHETREFWTPQQIREFETTDRGKMLRECIDTENFTPYVSLINRALVKWLSSQGLAKRLLITANPETQDEIFRICRDVAHIASIVKRRGMIPDQITEREEIIVPDETYGLMPSFRKREQSPMSLQSSLCCAVKAISNELDSNVLDCYHRAVMQRGEQIIKTSSLSPSAFSEAINHIVVHRVLPNHIVMNLHDYVLTGSFGSDFLKAPPLKIALETKNYGTINGIPIEVTDRIPTGRILVCGPKHQVGVLKETKKVSVKHSYDHSKGIDYFTYSGDYGILIVNEWAISEIDINSTTV